MPAIRDSPFPRLERGVKGGLKTFQEAKGLPNFHSASRPNWFKKSPPKDYPRFTGTSMIKRAPRGGFSFTRMYPS
jgi:hypothetical protein